jgi:hypothetical protein
MPILKINQNVTFSINFKVVKAFVFEHDVYYIVVVLKKNTPLNHMQEIAWGCLSTDGTHDKVPEGAFQKASELVTKIDFKNLE